MVPTYHATDGPRGTLLIRVGWRDVGLINKPPELGGGYRPYRLSGEPLPGEHLTIISTALACCADSGRRSLWSCDSDAAIAAIDADIGGS